MNTSVARQKTALIMGGGIGGLATAIALRRVGVQVRVFERASEIREVGAGLSLWPNGLRALDHLGLGRAVRARGLRDMHSALRTWQGRVLVQANSGELERALGDVSLVIHRAELLSLLRRELPDDALVTGASCVAVSEHEASVVARFADGRRVRGDFVVGADGIHSAVRAAMFGQSPPQYAGYTAWRGVVSIDHQRLTPGVSIGRGCQFGQVPMADGKVYWFATQNGPANRVAPAQGWRAYLGQLFQPWHDPIPALIAATAESAILHNDIVDRPPLPAWGAGRVTLLGDAAHPATPNLGQGANQALEDAQALALSLAEHPDVVTALRRYEQARMGRANAVVTASRRVGQVMQLESPLACWMRDLFLRTRAATEMQMKQLRQLVSPAVQPSP